MLRQKFTSPKVIQERKKRLRIRLLLWTGLCIAVLLLISQLFRIPQTLITRISFSGNRVISQGELFKIVEQELEGSYLLLAPKQSAFLYPKQLIRQKILEQFPRIKNVSIALEGFKRLKIRITERKTNALWCDSQTKDMRKTAECVFVDSDGYAFAPAIESFGSAYITYYTPQPQDTMRHSVIEADEFHLLQKLTQNLKTLKLTVTSIAIDDSKIEIAVRFRDPLTGSMTASRILFSREESYEESFETLKTILESKEFKENTISLATLEYIDIRFGNKVYYKQRKEEQEQIE